MTTLSAPEIAEALTDAEPGAQVTLLVRGTVAEDGTGLEIESVEKQEEEEEDMPGENETRNRPMARPTKMPHGVAIIIGAKPGKV